MADTTVIAITPRLGVSLHEEVPRELQTSAYAVASRGWCGATIYDPHGRAHLVRAVETTPAMGPLRSFLAYTIYNPAVKARVLYEVPRSYTLDELREHLTRAVRADDDLLTQWHSEDELLQRLAAAATYHDFVAIVLDTGNPPSEFWRNSNECP